MQNCRRKAQDNNNSVKFTSSRGDNSTTNDSMVMKIAHAQLHMYTNIMYKFHEQYMQNCRRKAPDNNNSVKFTSSRGDNSTTNDSMVMHNFICTCKTVGEKLQTKLCPPTDRWSDGRTDRWTAMAIPVYPLHFVVGGIIKNEYYCTTFTNSFFSFFELSFINNHYILTSKGDIITILSLTNPPRCFTFSKKYIKKKGGAIIMVLK